MTLSDDRYADLLSSEVSEVQIRLIHDLEHAYRPASSPPRLDAAVLPALRAHWTTRPHGKHARRRLLLRPQIVGLATACALILGSLLTYLHGQSAAPVSAQTILHRAATAGLAPNQVTHFSYRLTASSGDTGTSDEWVAADARGAASRLVLSNAVLHDGAAVPALDLRLVQTGDTVQVYDPASNTVTTSPIDKVDQPWESIVVGTRLAQKLSDQTQSSPSSQILQKGTPTAPPQRTLDGVSVYVLQLSPNGDQTLYVDTHSYIPRGADWSEGGVSWQARLLRDDTMSASVVPADTFSLNSPETAKVIQEQPDKLDYPVDLGSAFAQACRTTPAAFKAAMGRSPDQSMLVACQQTNPSITSAQLGAALGASAKTQLDAAVAAGQISAAQAADQLARMQAKLGATITAPSGMPIPTPST